jgi:riboflavin biosynthesis pyrimidine reductase
MQSQLRSHHKQMCPRRAGPVLPAGPRSDSLSRVRQIYPDADPAVTDDDELLARRYAYPPGPSGGEPWARPWVRANMVASADGAAAVEGRSGGLGSAADRKLFYVLRSLADVILVGGGTARAEKYKPARQSVTVPALRADRPPTPPIAVVSASLDLDPASPLLAQAPGWARTIVLTTAAAPADRRAALARVATVIEAGEKRVEADLALDALAGLGHGRILTEGGPRLLGHITAAGRLDDLCLTIGPLLAGGGESRILAGAPLPDGPVPLTLAHVLAEDGSLFCRYLRAD